MSQAICFDASSFDVALCYPRSKLAAAILGGVDKIHMQPGSKVLYLGAASGTSVSHVSDIVGPVRSTIPQDENYKFLQILNPLFRMEWFMLSNSLTGQAAISSIWPRSAPTSFQSSRTPDILTSTGCLFRWWTPSLQMWPSPTRQVLCVADSSNFDGC